MVPYEHPGPLIAYCPRCTSTLQQQPEALRIELRTNCAMTNRRGKYFISYRRSPARQNGTQEAILVRDALRDRGAPTWRDLDDLASEPTEDELVATLTNQEIAGAVMLISPEVRSSPIIRNVEAYRIFQRHRANDGFLIKPVLIGLEYAEANEVLDGPGGFQDLNNWNLHKLKANHLTERDAKTIARQIVKYRVNSIVDSNNDGQLNVGVFSRVPGSHRPLDLSHDFSPYFSGRTASPKTYHRIESAFLDTASILASTYDRVSIQGRGNTGLSVGVLFGAIYSPLANFRLSWLQEFAGHDPESWSVSSGCSDIALETIVTKGDPASEDIVLALGISASIERPVSEYISSSGLRPRASIHATIRAGAVPQGTPLSPQDGLSLSLQAVEAIRNLREDVGLISVRLHLFLACPLALAVLLGQKLNTFSQCTLYEHHPDRRPSYARVHTFNPSSICYSGQT